MKPSIATAILGKAYLVSKNMSTFDLRCFEYTNKNKQFTKIDALLEATKFLNLSEKEEEARTCLQNVGVKAVENDIDYVKELLNKCN